MSFLSLPNEILIKVASSLELDAKSLNSLLQTNRRFVPLITPLLHDIALQPKEEISTLWGPFNEHEFEMTALAWAAFRGHEPLVRLLLDKGADIEALDRHPRFGYTPLQLAIGKQNIEVARTLLKRGAKVDSLLSTGYTALHIATRQTDEASVRLLLDHGANINLSNNHGLTPLMMSVDQGAYGCYGSCSSETMVRLLLELGADVNAPGNDGYSRQTALHVAARYGERVLVGILLQNGACVSLIDLNGLQPWQLAGANGHLEVESILKHEEISRR